MTSKPHRSRRPGRAGLVVFATLWLGACTPIPEMNKAVPNWVRKADFPKLTALDPLKITKMLPPEGSDKIAQEMSARQERLKRKAKRLNAPVVDAATQARMNSGISQ